MTDAVSIVRFDDLDAEIDGILSLPDRASDLDRLARLVHERLMRRGAINSVSLILMAQDLHIIYSSQLWDVAGYTSFPEWVSAELEPQPWGCAYQTAMALINVWAFYHEECGWSVEEMATAGKAKLERSLAVARTTVTDGHIDDDLRACLLDTEVGHRRVLEDYEGRRAARETRKRLESGHLNGATEVSMSSRHPERPVYEADTRSGALVVWVPVNSGDKASVAIVLGKLNFQSENAQPWITAMLGRAGVRVK